MASRQRGPRPPRSPRRLRGGGTGEGADPDDPGPAGGPTPSLPNGVSSSSRNPRAALLPFLQHTAARPPRQLLSDVSLRGSRPRGGVSAVSYRRRRWGRRLKGKDPRKCPLLSAGEADAGGGVPCLPRRGWCIPGDVRSIPPLPGWCTLSDVRSRGRSCPSAPKAAGGLGAWGRGSRAARAPAPAPAPAPALFPFPARVQVPGLWGCSARRCWRWSGNAVAQRPVSPAQQPPSHGGLCPDPSQSEPLASHKPDSSGPCTASFAQKLRSPPAQVDLGG